MILQTLKLLFQRDLNKMREEINAYADERNLWIIKKGISNSAGNLCLHLIGNLNTHIGANLGNTGYIRNRDHEFTIKNIPRSELVKKIDETLDILLTTLDNLSEENLQMDYPVVVFAERTTIEYMLIHLTTHLAYHLGQINYHRRLLDT